MKTLRTLALCFIAIVFLFARGFAQTTPPAQGATTFPQINTDFFVGMVPGFYPTIQSAVTKACAISSGFGSLGSRVIVPAGSPATGTSGFTISAVTGGCAKVFIIDQRLAATTCSWGGSSYTCSSGGGGGATIAVTSNVIKGDGTGNGIAATPGTDYITPSAGTAANSTQVGGVALSGLCQTGGSGCPASGSGLSGQTTNFLPKATSATNSTTSSIVEDIGTGIVVHGTGSSHGSITPEGTAISGVANSDNLWADSTAHRLRMNNNNTGPVTVASLSDVATSSTNGVVKCATGTTCSTLSTVAATGQYNDLSNKPTQPTLVSRGLIALYLFNEGVGATVLHDTSGANSCSGAPCDITLTGAGTDPIMSGLGLNLIQVSDLSGGSQTFVNLPTGITGFRSMTAATYIAAPANGAFLVPTTWASNQLGGTQNYWSLLNNNVACCTGNFQIIAGANAKGFGDNPYIQANGGGPVTQAIDSFIGVATRTWTLGTGGGDLDHIYLNGAEANYISQGATASFATGAFTLGEIGWLHAAGFQSGFPGTVACLALYNVELTPQESLQNNLVCNQIMSNRGLNIVANPAPNTINEIACTGDSIFSNIGATTPLCSLLSGLSDTYTTNANGLPGWTCKDIQTLVPFREAFLFTTFTPKSIGIVECGNNDAQAGLTPLQTANANIALANGLVDVGAKKIFLTTLMSSVGFGTTDATLKDVINPLLRQIAQANGWGLIDYASYPNLGADGAASNTTYFLDGIHPTALSKSSYMAPAMDNAINELYGSTLVGGCPTTITSSTYSEAAADGCIRVNSTSNVVAVTLPSCDGYFRPRTIKNMAGVNLVTVVPVSPDLIDGSASAITVTTGSTLIVYPRVVDSTGVCHWERSQNN